MHSLAYPTMQIWLARDAPYLKCSAKMTYPLQNGNLQSIFAHSTSAVVDYLAKKSYTINTKSTNSFPISQLTNLCTGIRTIDLLAATH